VIDAPGPWGTGPYTLVEGFSSLENEIGLIQAEPFVCVWLDRGTPRSERVVLEANRDHWNAERGPRLERVVFRNGLPPAEALELVCTGEGEVDIVSEVAPADAQRVVAPEHAELVRVDAMRVLAGIVNRDAEGAPLHDVRRDRRHYRVLDRSAMMPPRSTCGPLGPCGRGGRAVGPKARDPMATGSINSFTLDIDELGWTGEDLQRPESVVAEPDGTLWTSDGRGGVTRIDPDGGQTLLGGWGGEPNGLAIDPDGNLVTANIGLGRVQQMTRDGRVSTVLEEVDGQRTTSANFVFYDRSGRLWLTCLTREDHWWPAVADARPDGFVVLVDDRGARIVADGIYATNEARLDADERYLYVAETMKARILRFPVRSDGSLGEREVFGPDGLGLGGFVDGFAFDAEGNLWVTTVVRNGIGVLTRDGDWHVVLEDPREDVLAAFVDKLAAGAATPEDMSAAAGPRLQFPTSVCFAGQDLRTAYVGSLAMPRLPTFRSPVPGLPMSHWR
jgi:gluconolactonase